MDGEKDGLGGGEYGTALGISPSALFNFLFLVLPFDILSCFIPWLMFPRFLSFMAFVLNFDTLILSVSFRCHSTMTEAKATLKWYDYDVRKQKIMQM